MEEFRPIETPRLILRRLELGDARMVEHLADAIELGRADAALAAGIFHFGECTIREVKELFQRRGIPVRPVSTAHYGDTRPRDRTV